MRCCLFCQSRSSSTEAPKVIKEHIQDVVPKQAEPTSLNAVEADSVGSCFTSARSEDLRDIQTIFKGANEGDGLAEEPTTVDSNVTKQINFATRLLKKLSRERRLDQTSSDDHIKLKELKHEIHKNLFNSRDPVNGGYDLDAREMPVMPHILSPLPEDEHLTRGRGLLRQNSVQSYDWPLPGTRRFSASTSPPRRISITISGPKRSRSFSSLRNARRLPYLTNFGHLRLPSFSAASSSKHWKQSVMESLHITSASTSALNHDADSFWHGQGPKHRQPSQTEPFPPFHEVMVTIPSRSFASSGTSVAASNSKSLEVPQHQHRPKNSPHNTSVHLYSMNISRQLRSTSLYSSMMQSADNSGPVSMDARCRRLSSSGFASGDVPASWGQVLTGASSSIYSSHPGSTALSSTDLLKSPKDAVPLDATPPSFGEWRPLQVPGTIDTPPSIQRKLMALPTNPSTSTLGKESRFKEELDISAPVNKRNSMLGFFGYGHKKSSDRFHQSDGSCDERKAIETQNQGLTLRKSKEKPLLRKKRLGRKDKAGMRNSDYNFNGSGPDKTDEDVATPHSNHGQRQCASDKSPEDIMQTDGIAKSLCTRKDATGLMAKAINATEQERMQFLLPGHRDLGPYSLVRQRSSSFCRPVELSSSDNALLTASRCKEVTPSHSDTCLKPEFSVPGFQAEDGPINPRERFLSAVMDPREQNHHSQSSKSSKAPSLGTSVISRAGKDSQQAPSSSSPISRRSIIEDLDDTKDPLGAWSRYPSHSRPRRAGSAGTADRVITRDFAYDINPSLIADGAISACEDASKTKMSIRRKNKIGKFTAPTLERGKNIMKQYGRFFSSTNLEYLKHGHGHRSSIAAGGELKDPDLEILPGPSHAHVVQEAISEISGSDPVQTSAFMSSDTQKKEGAAVFPVDHDSKDREKGESLVPPDLFDGLTDETYHSPRLQTLHRSLSLPELDQPNVEHVTEDATLWSERYQSCVLLPPPTRSGTDSRGINYSITPRDHPKGSIFSQSQDSRLFVPHFPSSRVTSTSTPCSGDYVDAMSMQCMGASMSQASTTNSLPSRLRHGHNKDKSMASIRQSSYDLLLMLKEAEEKERLKAMGLDVDQGEDGNEIEFKAL